MTSPEASAAIEMTSEEAADGRPSEDDGAPPPPLPAGGDSPDPGPEPDSGPDSGSESGSDSDSGQSGISNISGLNWKPNAGPICWVQQQIGAGVDPREVLGALRPGIGHIPRHIDDITLWKMIIEIVTEPPRREKLRHVNTLSDVVRLIRGASNVIVLTGAGVSVSCGIPDFRSRDGIYARLAEDFPDLPDPQAMFDIHYFRKDPRPFFKFAREIYPGQFKPSPCHRFIRLLERQRKLLRNYTQNIDTLEQQAGIENVIQCHGSFATASCQRCKYKAPASAIREDIFQQTIPLCPRCTAADAALQAAEAAASAGGGEGATACGAVGSASEGTGAGGGGDSPAATADGATSATSGATSATGDATGATGGDDSKPHHSRGAAGHPSPKHVAHDVFAAEARDSVTGAAVTAAVAAADAAGMDEALHHGCIEHHLGTHVGAHDGAHDGAHSGTHTGARGGSHSRKHGGTHGEKHVHHGGKHSRTHGSAKHHGGDDCSGERTAENPAATAAAPELPKAAVEPAARTAAERSSKESPADEDTADSGFAGPAREAEDEAAGKGAHAHEEEEDEEKDDKPRAPIMKPDIVFFGEGLPDEFHNSLEHDRDLCDLLIIIGSSLKVRPVALIPSSVGADVAQILINREPLPHLNCDVQLLGDCDVIVHHLCHLLGGPFTELFDDGSGEAGPPKPPLKELTELPPRPADASPPPAADPTSENDTDALRNCWQRKRNESLAARLPEGTFLHQPPCRYVFPGAEVIVDPDDDSDDSDRDSLDSDGAAGSPSTRQTSVTPTALDACPSSPSGSAAVGAGEPKTMDVGDVDASADNAIRGSKRPLDASDPPPAATADVAVAEGPQPKKTHEDGTDGITSDACGAADRTSN